LNKLLCIEKNCTPGGVCALKELLESRGVKIAISSSKEESDTRMKKVFHGK